MVLVFVKVIVEKSFIVIPMPVIIFLLICRCRNTLFQEVETNQKWLCLRLGINMQFQIW